MPHRSELRHYQCQTCEWFRAPVTLVQGSNGTCHYKAPDATGMVSTAFPMVRVDDWCRHHYYRDGNRPVDPEDD